MILLSFNGRQLFSHGSIQPIENHRVKLFDGSSIQRAKRRTAEIRDRGLFWQAKCMGLRKKYHGCIWHVMCFDESDWHPEEPTAERLQLCEDLLALHRYMGDLEIFSKFQDLS